MSRRCVPYTPVDRALSALTVALVSTAGVHQKDQEPFDRTGDLTYRVLGGAVDVADLTVTHGAPLEHYDTRFVAADANTVFPIDRLRELAAVGLIGGLADKHISLMGYTMRLSRFLTETAPRVAQEIERSRADAVLLTAG